MMSNSDAGNQTCLYLKHHSMSDHSYERDSEEEKDVFNETFEVDSNLTDNKQKVDKSG